MEMTRKEYETSEHVKELEKSIHRGNVYILSKDLHHLVGHRFVWQQTE